MSNIRRRTAGTSTIGVSTPLSILLMALLASISGLNISSFSQEENNDGNDDDISLILTKDKIGVSPFNPFNWQLTSCDGGNTMRAMTIIIIILIAVIVDFFSLRAFLKCCSCSL